MDLGGNKVTTELLEIMQKDIKRCEDAQDSNEGTYCLYQALVAKYNGIFEGFEEDIPTSGKATSGGREFNYRPELNAIKERLELFIATDREKDPLFNFKAMYEEDLESLKKAISDSENRETPELAKLQLYKDVTAKYHPYIPKLSDGLYAYIQKYALYDDVSGESLLHNLKQVYNKMLSFKALGYPSLKETIPQGVPMVQITNTNENKVDIKVSFSDVRKEIENMSALPDVEIEEILSKINDLEKIVKSSDRKSKKWENAKSIVKWIADKGVDVGIALLPLLLQIK